ncbi:MAG: polysaccharide biosynthesis tyrosine autokinase [Candidatus Omnitrophica bacterium]|nr:polysaccharide biosynthesis tyrosine autokinase [Candidatus Omnitrophota bacterium]
MGFLQTEFRIITSPAVMEKVLSDLHLLGFAPFNKSLDPVALLQGMLEPKIVRGTKLVDVTATGAKPELVARIANAVADAYSTLNLKRRQEMTAGGAQWLVDEVGKTEEKMRTSQLVLQGFLEQHGTVDFGTEQQNTILQRLRELSNAVTEVKKQRIEAETKYRRKHPIILEMEAKERELEEVLGQQEQRALEMNRLSIQYNELEREAKTTEGIYNALLTRSKELAVQSGLQTNNVKVAYYAKVPHEPSGPSRGRAVLLAAFLGFLLGSGLSVLKELLAKTLRTRQEFEQVLEIPFLGHVPLIPKRIASHGREDLIILNLPQSTSAEAIRSLRTTLEFLLPAGQSHALMITSALPSEGKSLICANLAVALQELGRKVLLVDGDLRRPNQHRVFQIPLEPGLSGYLQDSIGADQLVQKAAAADGLCVIPAGLTPSQPAELLISPKLQEILEAWKKEYQYVLIDTPPVLAVADATALATIVDGTIFLLRADRTHRDVALAGKQRLVDVGAKLIGGVLNGARLELERGYRYYYYYYRGGKRYYHQKASGSTPRQTEKEPSSPRGDVGVAGLPPPAAR